MAQNDDLPSDPESAPPRSRPGVPAAQSEPPPSPPSPPPPASASAPARAASSPPPPSPSPAQAGRPASVPPPPRTPEVREYHRASSDFPPRDADRSERERKRLFERAIPELVKGFVERAVERGVEKLSEGPENVRQFVNDLKLPKEVLHYLYTQIDETKNGLYRVVAKEIRDVLEQTQFADEITKVLTKLSFEIKTEIRFVPNEAARSAERERGEDEPKGSASLPKPEVTAQVSVKDRTKDARRDRRRREGT